MADEIPDLFKLGVPFTRDTFTELVCRVVDEGGDEYFHAIRSLLLRGEDTHDNCEECPLNYNKHLCKPDGSPLPVKCRIAPQCWKTIANGD